MRQLKNNKTIWSLSIWQDFNIQILQKPSQLNYRIIPLSQGYTSSLNMHTLSFFKKLIYLFWLEANYFTMLWWVLHTFTWISHGAHVSPGPEPSPTSLPIPSLWVVPVHQLWMPCFMHWTWTGHLFHIWQYTCFNAILSNHPTLSLSHRIQKTVLYICVSFAVSHRGLSFF